MSLHDSAVQANHSLTLLATELAETRTELYAMNERRAEAERRFNRLDAAVTRYHEDPDALLKVQQKIYREAGA